MNESTILKAVLQGKGADIKEKLISENQIDIVHWVKSKKSANSADLSNYKRISVQHASMLLQRLHALGYLKRVEKNQKSGGIRYVYTVPTGFICN